MKNNIQKLRILWDSMYVIPSVNIYQIVAIHPIVQPLDILKQKADITAVSSVIM